MTSNPKQVVNNAVTRSGSLSLLVDKVLFKAQFKHASD
ncbi:hypothetical protein GPAL_0923 [Glaciecola pallidula DSM 14239 = ACAM 615]|uniref:Uncharacterized protein n=1 Tax=Brumicola pallidula DSM 14239 = ACAM 615 TaxID=1121922 RepID=K6ZFX2_9ALTE|nr:hypothetical protein GPAL_0923 [Glaciecola pallidula DSM 14239 = ACAM 615]